MKLRLNTALLSIGLCLLTPFVSKAQVTLLKDYMNNKSAAIGTFQGINFREAGFSSLYPIANTNGKEFWTISDRGVNVDCASANPAECHPTYDKLYAFPTYAPKIHRIRVNGDSIQILQSISMKRPNGTTATGLLNPAGYGSTEAEMNSTDTVLTCTNFMAKTVAKDIWGIDSEGIVVDKDGNFWICEEGGPTIWKLNPNGVVVKRFTPYANLANAQSIDIAIDTVFKYRKNNRGFEGISITPNGKIYAIIQSPILYPTTAVGEASRIHRILEINPATNETRMFAYVNEGLIGSGSNQVRLKDWKIGDMAAINNNEFLLIEVGIRGTTDSKKVYKIDISGATPVTSGLYNGKTLEALVDGTGLSANGIVPVGRTLFLDLVANGWPSALDKAEGLAIINDSTVAFCNDNDFGQTCPNADGIAIPTSNLSHMFVFGLKGANKLSNYVPFMSALAEGTTGLSTSTTPYLVPITSGVKLTSILSAKDVIGNYKMCGTPDGLGAFDNNDGTFTLLMNHEFVNTAGIARAHGSKGTFVSKWVIKKSDLTVLSGSDLMQNVNLWNGTGYTNYNSSNPSSLTAFARFCSADLPAVSAYYNAKTGMGTQARIFMNGEENGNEGRVLGHIASGSAAGTSYELPALGKASWENLVARPVASDKTVVVGMDDSTPGQVYVYVGNKTNTGTDVEKAGLTNGKLYGVSVTGMLNEGNASFAAAGTTFTLVDLGDVKNLTGATINSNSNNLGVTNFLRPEDGAWDPSNLNDFYFNTTNAITSPSRLWRLRFSDMEHPEAGGTVEAVLDGTEGQKMLDNLTIDHFGHVLLVEDVGGDAHIGRVLQYDIATDVLTTVAEHDRTRFLTGGANFLTQDEEASGILDVQEILGPGMFLTSDQAHYSIAGEVVEGGQLLALFNPDTYNANPEISLTAINSFGTVTTGNTTTQNVTISNAGPGALKIKAINFSGTEYSLDGTLTFPISIAAGASQIVGVKLSPLSDGTHNATMTIENNDFDESTVEVTLTALSVSPEISIKGNNVVLTSGATLTSALNNTYYGIVRRGTTVSKSFVVENPGTKELTIQGIAVSGSNASDFNISGIASFPATVAPGSTQNISVSFTPSADGLRSGTISVTSDDLDEASFTFLVGGVAIAPKVQIKGNGVVIASGDITPSYTDNTDFGSVSVGASKIKSFLIQNLGSGELSVSNIAFSGLNASEFALAESITLPLVVPANQFRTINVKYTPSDVKLSAATISITTDDLDKTVFDFDLKGLAVAATGVFPAGSLEATGIEIYPNPAGDLATISVTMEKAEHVTIAIVDTKGAIAAPSMERDLAAGKNEITLSTAGLENGTYYVQITSLKGTKSIKAVVAH